MLEEFDTLDEWARWKVLEVALQANEEISTMQKKGNTQIELLFPILETLSVTLGTSEIIKVCPCAPEYPCSHDKMGGEECIIIECATESGVLMRLNYDMKAPVS